MIVSVIIPVHDEPKTISCVIDQIYALRMPDVEFQVIVVCSLFPSMETWDAIVCSPHVDRIYLIGERYPEGKGAAVRRGLKVAVGEIVIIQDADMEYKIADYERLLSPIISGKCDFVLGQRVVAGGSQPMRSFGDNQFAAWLMNFGHHLFAFLLNLILCTRMKDPFTMFKVFRHRCIRGMNFSCNRFDFDFELVSKLVRAGYTPTEIPVDYKSRGFQEGKKVRMVRDPMTWLWFLTKLLFRAI